MNDPFVQLERSHRRLEEACAALLAAAKEHDIDTVTDVCAFFGRQGRRHEEDEEISLFPRLARLDATPELGAVIGRLSAEHRAHEALHARLERVMSGRDDEGGAPHGTGDLWSALGALAEEIAQAYRAHIAEEEQHLFPAARAILDGTALEGIMQEMDERRGRGRTA